MEPISHQRQTGELMDWARILAFITGTVDQELLLPNEYLAAEDRILRGQPAGQAIVLIGAGSRRRSAR